MLANLLPSPLKRERDNCKYYYMVKALSPKVKMTKCTKTPIDKRVKSRAAKPTNEQGVSPRA